MAQKPITINTPEDIQEMRIVGRLASEQLDWITQYVKPGVSTLELDKLLLHYTEDVQHCKSACLNYCPPGCTPYPACACISVNNVVCHGIPSAKKILKKGDIVNIDITIERNGYYGDNSRMYIVGKPSIAGKRLVDATFGTMWAGIDVVRPGRTFNDVAVACHNYASNLGLSVVREYGGHGIGRDFHGEPFVSHYPLPGPSPELKPGMIFTVEPMVNAGRHEIMDLNDGWSVVTKDHSLSAQWELEVLVTETGYDILTVSKGSPEPPAFVTGWKKPNFD